MRLLDGGLEPITASFGFVQAPCEAVASWWQTRDAAFQAKRGVSVSSRVVSGELEAMLRSLLPLTSVEIRRVLMLRTISDWTAVFDSNWRGGGDAAWLSSAAEGLGCKAVRVVAAEELKSGGDYVSYGARMFEFYGPERTEFLNYLRTISVANDGGRWRMDQSGKPLPCEQTSWFEAKRVKDRFQVEHLASLLRALGIDAFDERYYGADGVLVERQGPTAPGFREYELAEVHATWTSGKK